jgi:uncharacterized protein involved in exopolysaccharide biosynthesis
MRVDNLDLLVPTVDNAEAWLVRVTTRQSIDRLRTQTIPAQVNVLIGRLTQQKRETEQYMARAAGELRAIPRRVLDEDRLVRTVAVQESLYTALRDRYQRARAAEASVVPDVSVLDTAVAPISPIGDRAPLIMARPTLAPPAWCSESAGM